MIPHAYKLSTTSTVITFSLKNASGEPFSISLSRVIANGAVLTSFPAWLTLDTSSLYYVPGAIYASASQIDVTMSIDTAHATFDTESVYRFIFQSSFSSGTRLHEISFYGKSFEVDQQSGLSELWSPRYSTYSATGSSIIVLTASAFVNSARSFGISFSYFASHRGSATYRLTRHVSTSHPIANVLNATPGSSYSLYAVMGFAPVQPVTMSAGSVSFHFLSGSVPQLRFDVLGVFVNTISRVTFTRLWVATLHASTTTYSGIVVDLPTIMDKITDLNRFDQNLFAMHLFEVHGYGSIAEFWVNGSQVYVENNASTNRIFNNLRIQYSNIAQAPQWLLGDLIIYTTSLSFEEKRRIRRKLHFIYDTPI